LKEAKIGPKERKFLIFFFLSIFYLPLFNSVTKKNPRLKKYWGGGAFASTAPQVTPMGQIQVFALLISAKSRPLVVQPAASHLTNINNKYIISKLPK
jgi:hypothetical protein